MLVLFFPLALYCHKDKSVTHCLSIITNEIVGNRLETKKVFCFYLARKKYVSTASFYADEDASLSQALLWRDIIDHVLRVINNYSTNLLL